MPTGAQWRTLYKSLLREATKFHSYNNREFFKRRIYDHFRENRNERDAAKLE